jgi:hypothetical protein
MNAQRLELRVHVAWWLPIYIYGVAIAATLMDAEIDEAKLDRWIERALSVRACR